MTMRMTSGVRRVGGMSSVPPRLVMMKVAMAVADALSFGTPKVARSGSCRISESVREYCRQSQQGRRAIAAHAVGDHARIDGVRAYATEADSNRFKVSMVTGASRGIGLAMVNHLLDRGGQVVAACRDPASSPELTKLVSDSGGRLLTVAMDVTSENSILRAVEEVSQRHSRLDLLVNVVGILHNTKINMMPETALNKVTAENMLLSYQTNAMGPLLVAKAFTDLLSARARDSEGIGVLASVSARVGSISDNKLGGWYSYRASKAALNMLMVNVALENTRRKRPFSCIMLHPGTVDTDLSKPFQRNVPVGKLFTREQCVDYLMSIIDNITIEDNGKFFAWDGSEVPF